MRRLAYLLVLLGLGAFVALLAATLVLITVDILRSWRSLYLVWPALAAFTSILGLTLALVLGLGRRLDRTARALGLLCLVAQVFPAYLVLFAFGASAPSFPGVPSWLWDAAQPRLLPTVISVWVGASVFLYVSTCFPEWAATPSRSAEHAQRRWAALQALSGDPVRLGWLTAALVGGSFAALELGEWMDPGGAGVVVLLSVLLSAAVVILAAVALVVVRNVRDVYRVAEAKRRRQIRWLLFGFASAAWLTIAVGLIQIVFLAVGPLLVPLVPLVLVLSIFLAVFYDGAVDPTWAIRGTAVWGAMSLVLLFAFAAVENLLSDLVAEKLGLTDFARTLVAGGVAALVLLPLKAPMDRVIRQRMSF